MTIEDDELLKDFVIESQEHLAKVECQLLELESENDVIDVAKVNNVFRAIHSIKGVAGFLNLKTLETLAHREEEILNLLRNCEVRPTSDVINTLLKASDCIKTLLDAISTSNEIDVSEHITALDGLLKNPSNLFESQSSIVSSSISEIHPCITENNEGERGEDQKIGSSTLRDYLIESHDNLQQLEDFLVRLEKIPKDQELLKSIFRTVHTLKGSSGFLGFKKLEALTHASENLLTDLRAGNIGLDSSISSTLFSSIDLSRKYLEQIELNQNEGDLSPETLIDQLNQIHQQKLSIIALSSQRSDSPSSAMRIDKPFVQSQPIQNPLVEKNLNNFAPTMKNSIKEKVPTATTSSNDLANTGSAADSTIRVDVALLDKLMTRVGELVLARNQILQCSNSLGDGDLESATHHLNLITTELQEGVMKTRMQPIGNVWSKFPRLVRDLAAVCGKVIRIEMEGKETELDKTIIEAIKDPLTHLVRNNVDHGIEKPDVRIANGKPAEGCLTLRAFHEGGQVNIVISDDGGGLNLERIKTKAIEKGLVTVDQASKLNDHETTQLIFLPGFSTAETVSNVSGRGVGMDVVKTNIEKIGGSVDLQTKTGEGTSIKIKIPLTLAIIPALIITNNGSRFAIPQVNLLELVRLDTSQNEQGIEWIQGSPVYRLRGKLLPLVYLRQILKSKKTTEPPSDCISIVVLRVDDRQFGLVVDRIIDTEEIVVKPMAKQLKGVTVFAGATIMGDGKVALILDVLGLAHSSQVLSKDRHRAGMDNTGRGKDQSESKQTLLILGTGSNRRLALPISQVARLEKIPQERIEQTNKQEVVQYRGRILPLIRLANIFSIEDLEEPLDGLLNVVVYTENERNFGLVVTRVIDIVETVVEISEAGACNGLLGTAIIQDHVTDLIDLPAVIKQIHTKPRIVTEASL